MSEIKLSNLNPAGSELFQDSESYISELNEQEMGSVVGGFTLNASAISVIGNSVIGNSIVGNSVNANTLANNNSVQISQVNN